VAQLCAARQSLGYMTRKNVLWIAWVVMVGHGAMACSDGPDSPGLEACEGQNLAGMDLAGIWHFHVVFDPVNDFAAALRLDHDGTGGYTATVSGRSAASVTADDSGLEVVVEYPLREGQAPRVVTLRACTIDSTGTVSGVYQFCAGDSCFPATLIGRKVEPLDEPVSSGLTLISEYGGPPDGAWRQNDHITVNVRVHAGMAYLARYGDGLRIVDLGALESPQERGHAPVAESLYEYYNDVKIIEGPDSRVYAIMASNLRGAVVIDVSDPDAPVEVTSFPDAGEASAGLPSIHTLFVEGTRAYLAYTYDASLRIYDLSEPTQPQPLGGWRHPGVATLGGYLHDLYVENGRAYLNYWNLGMSIVDTVDDPQNPTLVGEYVDYGQTTSHSSWVTTVGARRVAVHGDEQYGAHVRIVDVDDDSVAFLDTLGSYQTRPEVSVHNILAHGDRAYVTYYQDGLRVLDLQDPGNPRVVAHYHTWPGAEPGYGDSFFEGAVGIDFDPVTGLIYVVDTHRGLFVLAPE
jgi:hypothetical protein